MSIKSFKQAAEIVLQNQSEPKSAREITEIAMERGYLQSDGKTPEATMAAQLYVDINTNEDSPFIKAGRGLFSLKSRDGAISSPAILLQEQNEKVKKELKDRLHAIDPFQFEYLVGDLLKKIGFENVEVTKRSGDKGVDILADLTVGGVTDVKTVVQVKRYKDGNRIPGSVIRELRGTAEVDQRGLVITTSDFQKQALEEAKAANKMPVSLINGKKLVELLVRYEVGVKKQAATILSIDVEYFENDSGVESGLAGSSGKSKAIWPLPGGTTQYVDTLNAFLRAVGEGNKTREDLIDWLIDSYDNVQSRKSGYGYTNVPRSMGLVEIVDGVFQLTESGVEYSNTWDVDLLYSIISEHVLAFDDIVELISSAQIPLNDQEILDFVNDNFDVEWTTFAQVNFRLLWLLNLGKIKKTQDSHYSV